MRTLRNFELNLDIAVEDGKLYYMPGQTWIKPF